jgi:hypothetical protein
MSRLVWLANPQYLRYIANKRIVVPAATRARAGANSVLRVLDCAPLPCTNASPAQNDQPVPRMN